MTPRLSATVLAFTLSGCLYHPPIEPDASLQLSPSSQTGDRLTARFFGVSTVLIADGRTAVMTDGFLTRPALLQILLGPIGPDDARIDYALARGKVDRLAAVFVAHSHYDHAMDSARVAGRTGAKLIGTRSTAFIAEGDGFPMQDIRDAGTDGPFRYGGFTVTAFASPHSEKSFFFQGPINRPVRPPVWVGAYKEGGNYSYLVEHRLGSVLVHGSTNVTPGLYDNVRADIVFLGIATLGREEAKVIVDYWDEIVRKTNAKLVVPVHWDNFGTPLDRPLEPLPMAIDDFDRAMGWLKHLAARDNVKLALMPLFEPIDIMAVVGK
jgi:L-ascorbate metabolism protein UlaG (beta-lactamase superfamily)